ncbi:maturation control protein [Xenorhabdus sp. XENO-10]|uniref:Maturation control protein n=1 Tax=Xenorhabdus yunnanensis TaxID=3025878 RepID=A0ABT5LJU9_9GAMM|nr:maturation control protein [Xenorhabdus yunnanensis]MDC9590731.1 maturation control protein [Xenorhabdus yunnanensis]
MIQRIAVISTMKKPVMVRAVFKDGDLILEDRKMLPPKRKTMLDELLKDLPKMVKAGFKVLVDEISGEIAQHIGAVSVRLSDKHYDGRPVIVVAVERYNELKRQGSIIYPPRGKNLYEISQSLIDVEFNPAGEPIYRVDWESLTPEHILMLLVVYSTMFNNVASDTYIRAMQSSAVSEQPSSLFSSFLNIISTYDEKTERKAAKSTLTGTRIDKNTVIL